MNYLHTLDELSLSYPLSHWTSTWLEIVETAACAARNAHPASAQRSRTAASAQRSRTSASPGVADPMKYSLFRLIFWPLWSEGKRENNLCVSPNRLLIRSGQTAACWPPAELAPRASALRKSLASSRQRSSWLGNQPMQPAMKPRPTSPSPPR